MLQELYDGSFDLTSFVAGLAVTAGNDAMHKPRVRRPEPIFGRGAQKVTGLNKPFSMPYGHGNYAWTRRPGAG
jgi:hypothetical protein